MIGLVLEGGGARGSYHIGAYKAILEEGIKIDGITGTSIGSINAAMIVQGDFDACYELWERVSYSMVIDASDEEIESFREIRFKKDELKTVVDKLKIIISDGGLDITPFRELLDVYIDEDRVRDSPMDFGLVTINLTDLMVNEVFKEDIPYGELKDYLLASAYLPVFKHEKLSGKHYLDGAFYDNLPFKMLQNKGYDKLILVRTRSRGLIRRYDKYDDGIIVISPSDDIGETHILDSAISKRNIELGYYDTLRAFRNLKGRWYYVLPTENEEYFYNILFSLDDDKINELKKLLRISDSMPNRRALFESIIPRLGSILGLDRYFSYEDLLIGLLEKKAEILEIDRFNIYSFEELLSLVKDKNRPVEPSMDEELTTIQKIIEIFNKDEILLNASDIIF